VAVRAASDLADGPGRLVTAVILGVARIAGETAPVLFVAEESELQLESFSGQQDDLHCGCIR